MIYKLKSNHETIYRIIAASALILFILPLFGCTRPPNSSSVFQSCTGDLGNEMINSPVSISFTSSVPSVMGNLITVDMENNTDESIRYSIMEDIHLYILNGSTWHELDNVINVHGNSEYILGSRNDQGRLPIGPILFRFNLGDISSNQTIRICVSARSLSTSQDVIEYAAYADYVFFEDGLIPIED